MSIQAVAGSQPHHSVRFPKTCLHLIWGMVWPCKVLAKHPLIRWCFFLAPSFRLLCDTSLTLQLCTTFSDTRHKACLHADCHATSMRSADDTPRSKVGTNTKIHITWAEVASALINSMSAAAREMALYASKHAGRQHMQ